MFPGRVVYVSGLARWSVYQAWLTSLFNADCWVRFRAPEMTSLTSIRHYHYRSTGPTCAERPFQASAVPLRLLMTLSGNERADAHIRFADATLW